MSNSIFPTNEKQTAAYLKRRAQRLIKKAKFSTKESSKEAMIQSANRMMTRANELYFNA